MKNNLIQVFCAFALIITLGSSAHAAASADGISKVLEDYRDIQQSLSKDSLVGVKAKAEHIIPAARSLADKALSSEVQKGAKLVVDASGSGSDKVALSKVRESFKTLSATFSRYFKKHPQKEWQTLHCDMAKADWIQKSGEEIQNPYYGSEMLSCGEKVQ